MYINIAPMDGITDAAYRYIIYKIFKKYKKPTDQTILTTEFMSSDGWIKNPSGVKKHLLTIKSHKTQTFAQIFGGNLENLIKTAQDIQKMEIFNGIELNIGCPSPKIMKTGGGSALMKTPGKTEKLIIKLAQSLKIPFSIKTRTGFNNDLKNERFETLVKVSPFVKMITIHGRTYTQGHSGEVDRNYIYRLKEKIKSKTTIIGNGGIQTFSQAITKKQNLDGIAIGRGAIGNPWVITSHKPGWGEKKEIIIYHFNLMKKVEDYTNSQSNYHLNPSLKEVLKSPSSFQNKAIIEFRKHFMSYIKGHPNASQLRSQISKIYNYDELKKFLSSI